MYFIKCTNCGYDNPLKTEYLTFCEHCGKKLPVNFPEWKRLHPTKEFDDFKKSVGTGIPSIQVKHKQNRIPLVTAIAVAVLLMIITVVMLFFSSQGDLAGLFLPGKTPGSVLNHEWQRFTYGKYGLSIESPVRLEKKELEIPEAYKEQVKEIESFYYRPSRGFQLLITSVLYEEGITANLNGAAVGAMNELINQPGVSNVEFKQSPLMNNDVVGLLLEGSYNENDIFMRFHCAVYTRQSLMWNVMVTFRDQDEVGKKAAEKVLESIDINYYVKSI